MKTFRRRMFRLAMAASLALLLCTTSCALYRNDRMWIPDEKYEVAKNIYNQTGSLALTVETLRESHEWRRAEINQVVYQLKKEFDLE